MLRVKPQTAIEAVAMRLTNADRDTKGNWDQLLTRDDRFAGFKSHGGTDDLQTGIVPDAG